jgi:adenylate kinase family enzyme
MNSPSEPGRVIAIFGPPGAGKTTVARALVDILGAAYVSSGDIAREVDPGALAKGQMANRRKLRDAFKAELAKHPGRIVVDGLPRDPTDVEYLPPAPETMFVLLNVLPGIANERQLRRGRIGDEPEIIERRTREQRALMELDKPDGWSFQLAGWKQSLLTDRHTAQHVIRLVSEYVAGRRSTIG